MFKLLNACATGVTGCCGRRLHTPVDLCLLLLVSFEV